MQVNSEIHVNNASALCLLVLMLAWWRVGVVYVGDRVN